MLVPMRGIGSKDYGGDRWFAYAIMACIVLSSFAACANGLMRYINGPVENPVYSDADYEGRIPEDDGCGPDY